MVAAGRSRIGGVGLQIIRDWVLRFNARGPDGLRWEVTGRSRSPQGPGAVALGCSPSRSKTTVGRELKALGFAKISARPPPLRAKRAEAFKKNFPA